MKRLIKFKLWDAANSIMMYDDFVVHGTGLIFVSDNTRSAEYVTLLQLTGLNDKRGKYIYEGDILKCWDSSAKDVTWGLDKIHIGIIEYTPNCYSLKVPGKLIYDGGAVKQWEKDTYLDSWCNAENIEVIGNIYENPELI